MAARPPASASAKTIGVRVQGIYTTALTALLLERGYPIAQPGERTRRRFRLPESAGPGEVNITDRRDRQGVVLTGIVEGLDEIRAMFEDLLPHALFSQGDGAYTVEFPATVKSQLDSIRAGVLPTIPGHHRLKVVSPEAVDEAEVDLEAYPALGERLSRDLLQSLVYDQLLPQAPYEVDHVKAGERIVQARGRIREFRRGVLEVERQFKGGGRYDSLGEPIAPGDWGTITLREGDWVVRRQYFRSSGDLIGELYNINTPVELYPDHARYVDLEVDVAFLPPSTVNVVDEPVLRRKVDARLIPEALAAEAMRRAEELAASLRR